MENIVAVHSCLVDLFPRARIGRVAKDPSHDEWRWTIADRQRGELRLRISQSALEHHSAGTLVGCIRTSLPATGRDNQARAVTIRDGAPVPVMVREGYDRAVFELTH